jgi:hypothetical protein
MHTMCYNMVGDEPIACVVRVVSKVFGRTRRVWKCGGLSMIDTERLM